MPTASQIAQISGNHYLKGLIDVVRTEVPVIDHFDTYGMTGTRFLSLAIVGLPTPGFLNLNEGYRATEVQFALGETKAYRIGGSVEVPESSALLWNLENETGAGLPYSFETIQLMYKMKAQLRHVQQQIFTGKSNDAKGFPGLKELTPFVAGNTYTMAEVPQDAAFARSVLNVGGSTATTASSIYAVDYGPDKCCLRMGGTQGVQGFLKPSRWERSYISGTDPVDGLVKSQWWKVATAEGYVGLQLSGSNEDYVDRKFRQDSVRRAANVTAQVGFTCTEAVLDALIATFPPGYAPDVFFMSYRSQKQLQDSKTTSQTVFVGYGGRDQSSSITQRAPLPTEHRGIPIIVTDAIANNDAIEA